MNFVILRHLTTMVISNCDRLEETGTMSQFAFLVDFFFVVFNTAFRNDAVINSSVEFLIPHELGGPSFVYVCVNVQLRVGSSVKCYFMQHHVKMMLHYNKFLFLRRIKFGIHVPDCFIKTLFIILRVITGCFCMLIVLHTVCSRPFIKLYKNFPYTQHAAWFHGIHPCAALCKYLHSIFKVPYLHLEECNYIGHLWQTSHEDDCSFPITFLSAPSTTTIWHLRKTLIVLEKKA